MLSSLNSYKQCKLNKLRREGNARADLRGLRGSHFEKCCPFENATIIFGIITI